MNRLGYKQYLRRGAFGGIIGGLSLLVLAGAFNLIFIGYLHEIFTQLFFVMGVAALLGGVFAGGVIGLIIWVVTVKGGKEPQASVRFLIGTSALLAFSLVADLLAGEPYRLPFLIVCAGLIGGLPGLFARSGDAIVSSEQAQSRA